MRIVCLIIVLALTGGLSLRAQKTGEPRATTRIDSDSVSFDLNTHQAVYSGNVRISDPQMKMTCAQLLVTLPESGQHISHILAETNVVMDFTDAKGQTMHATGDRAIYAYSLNSGVTNETITLTGNARVETAQGTLTGEPIVWDRANNRMTATDQKMIFRQGLGDLGGHTNTPVNAPVGRTNFPPGTIQNIDKMTSPASQPHF